MDHSLAILTPASLAAVAAVSGMAALVQLVLLKRRPPAERERRRRLEVNARGRMVCGMALELQQDVLHYSYSVGGAEYSAAQDVSALRHLLPPEPAGPVLVKYLPSNPANSIVVCEQWSGMRKQKGASAG